MINEVFMLNPNTDWSINLDELKIEYEKNEKVYKRKLVQFLHAKLKGEDRLLTSK